MEIIKTYIVLDIQNDMGQEYKTLRKCHLLSDDNTYILEKSDGKNIKYEKISTKIFLDMYLNLEKNV